MINSISDFSFKFNSSVKFNFDGGDLTSDAGGLLIEEFMHVTGIKKLFQMFKTKDSSVRIHTDADNLHQVISQIFLSYYNDNDADELANEHVLTTSLNKKRLASQPSISRFYGRMDETTIKQLNCILTELRRMAYAIKRPEFIVFDLDSTLLDTYGNQEGKAFNFHYQNVGYHPLLCYDALTKDLIGVALREGSKYCSKDAADFLRPIFKEYTESYPDMNCMLRGDSDFATPEIYDLCEEHGVGYVIRLKENNILRQQAEATLEDLKTAVDLNSLDYACAYGEFVYQASSWTHPRRVVFKIAGKIVNKSRYKYFKLYSNCIHKKEFIETFINIQQLYVQLNE